MSKGKTTQTKVAEYFKTGQRAVSYWKRDGCKGLDPFDPLEICRWLRINRRLKPDLKKRIVEIEKEHAVAKLPAIKPPKTPEDRKTLEQFRDYFAEQLNLATAANLADEVKHWTDLLLKSEKCIREAQAHERKLGLEQGETIKREEVERILRAILFAGNACVKSQIKELCQGISMKTPAEIYKVLPPAILGGRIFEGLSAVTKSESEVQLPQWVVDCFVDESGNYLKGITK